MWKCKKKKRKWFCDFLFSLSCCLDAGERKATGASLPPLPFGSAKGIQQGTTELLGPAGASLSPSPSPRCFVEKLSVQWL